jgi:hypothetical protein
VSVTLWISVDGMVTTEKVEGARFDPHEAWCDVVRDALSQRKWEEVNRMLEKHDDDELTDPDDPDVTTYVLPVLCVPTMTDARKIIVRFCKLGIGTHPLLAPKERWYYLPNFDGTTEALWEISERFEKFRRAA